MEEVKKKKVAVDTAGNVMAFRYQSASRELEVEDYDPSFIDEEIFTEQSVNRFKVVDGIVVRRTDEEIKADPIYTVVSNEQKVQEFKANNGTDNEVIRACRELLSVPSIRSLLSAETIARIEATEAKVTEIKNKYI